MTTVAKPKLTLEEKAAILKENGVAVFQWLKPGWVDVNETIYRNHSSILFKGDENEGKRAVQICHERGIPVFEVRRRWIYFRRMGWCADVRWELIL